MSVLTDDKKYDIVVIDSAAFIHGAKIEYSGKVCYYGTICQIAFEFQTHFHIFLDLLHNF